MTKSQLVVFELEGTEVILKLKAGWADGRQRKTKLRVLRSLLEAFKNSSDAVEAAIKKLEQQK